MTQQQNNIAIYLLVLFSINVIRILTQNIEENFYCIKQFNTGLKGTLLKFYIYNSQKGNIEIVTAGTTGELSFFNLNTQIKIVKSLNFQNQYQINQLLMINDQYILASNGTGYMKFFDNSRLQLPLISEFKVFEIYQPIKQLYQFPGTSKLVYLLKAGDISIWDFYKERHNENSYLKFRKNQSISVLYEVPNDKEHTILIAYEKEINIEIAKIDIKQQQIKFYRFIEQKNPSLRFITTFCKINKEESQLKYVAIGFNKGILEIWDFTDGKEQLLSSSISEYEQSLEKTVINQIIHINNQRQNILILLKNEVNYLEFWSIKNISNITFIKSIVLMSSIEFMEIYQNQLLISGSQMILNNYFGIIIMFSPLNFLDSDPLNFIKIDFQYKENIQLQAIKEQNNILVSKGNHNVVYLNQSNFSIAFIKNNDFPQQNIQSTYSKSTSIGIDSDLNIFFTLGIKNTQINLFNSKQQQYQLIFWNLTNQSQLAICDENFEESISDIVKFVINTKYKEIFVAYDNNIFVYSYLNLTSCTFLSKVEAHKAPIKDIAIISKKSSAVDLFITLNQKESTIRIWETGQDVLKIFYNIDIENPKRAKGLSHIKSTDYLLIYGDQNIDLFQINEEKKTQRIKPFGIIATAPKDFEVLGCMGDLTLNIVLAWTNENKIYVWQQFLNKQNYIQNRNMDNSQSIKIINFQLEQIQVLSFLDFDQVLMYSYESSSLKQLSLGIKNKCQMDGEQFASFYSCHDSKLLSQNWLYDEKQKICIQRIECQNENEYLFGTLWQQCIQNCGQDNYTQFFKDDSTMRCKKCSSECYSCSTKGLGNFCLSCNEGKFLDIDQGICLDKCQGVGIVENDVNICGFECPAGLYLNEQHNCVNCGYNSQSWIDGKNCLASPKFCSNNQVGVLAEDNIQYQLNECQQQCLYQDQEPNYNRICQKKEENSNKSNYSSNTTNFTNQTNSKVKQQMDITTNDFSTAELIIIIILPSIFAFIILMVTYHYCIKRYKNKLNQEQKRAEKQNSNQHPEQNKLKTVEIILYDINEEAKRNEIKQQEKQIDNLKNSKKIQSIEKSQQNRKESNITLNTKYLQSIYIKNGKQ